MNAETQDVAGLDEALEALERRIAPIRRAPLGARKHFPRVLRKTDWQILLHATPNEIVFYVLDPVGHKRVKRALSMHREPFPGLIVRSDRPGGAGFQLDNAYCVLIRNCRFRNLYPLRVGSDCSIVLEEVKYSIGNAEYHIPLAFVLVLGRQITKVSAPTFLEDLIAYTMRVWREDESGRSSSLPAA